MTVALDDQPARIPATVRMLQERSRSIGFAMACEDRTGALLRTLAGAKPGGRLVELGTGTGIGTAWLLDGAGTDATLISVDLDADNIAIARGVIGDDPRVRFEVADAAAWLGAYNGRPFDLVFADCRPGKFTHRQDLLRHLAPGAIYVGDDLRPQPTWPADHQPRVDAFRSEMAAAPDLHVTLLDWASGLVLATRR